MTKNAVRFKHVRKPRLNYTIAYTFERHDSGVLTVNYGIAQCGKTDNFIRATGRMIASKRLAKSLEGPYESLYYGSFSIPEETGMIVSNVIQYIFENDRSLVLESMNDCDDVQTVELDKFFEQLLQQA